MKQIRRLPILAILFISANLLVMNSCRVAFVPSYDAQIADQVQKTAKKVDKFYISMLELSTQANNGRSYDKFVGTYIDIETELHSLLNENRVRPLNANSTRICEITLQLWQKYKEEHKTKNTLSDGLIKLNMKTFDQLFYAMQVADEGKKMAETPPQ